MPSKRKRRADGAPVAKRKVGAAPKRAAAQEGAASAAGASTAPSPAPAPTEAGVTQPLGPSAAASAAGASAAAASAPDATPQEQAPSAQAAGHAASSDDAGPSEPAPAPEGAAGAEASPSEEPPAPQAEADGEEEPPSDGKPSGTGKAKKRKSTRSERRRDRKKAKADRRAQLSPARRALRVVRTMMIVLAALAILAGIVAAAGISYHRWSAYDDAQDIQGTWYVSGTDTPIEVTADTIALSDDVAYRYKLDPSNKTIEFSFGNLKGQGHYRFSLDRQYLVIFDGDYTWEESLSADVAWLIQALKDHLLDQPNDLAQGAFYNVTLLSRSSADDSALSASVVTTPEGPRVVWSAPDAEPSGGDAGAEPASAPGGAGDASSSSSSSSSSSDVDSLLGNLSDRPAS